VCPPQPDTEPKQKEDEMTRDNLVQILGAVVAAATVLVTVVAVVHAFSV
jgi:hypothetical protein